MASEMKRRDIAGNGARPDDDGARSMGSSLYSCGFERKLGSRVFGVLTTRYDSGPLRREGLLRHLTDSGIGV
jgi:hypothetical protein